MLISFKHLTVVTLYLISALKMVIMINLESTGCFESSQFVVTKLAILVIITIFVKTFLEIQK